MSRIKITIKMKTVFMLVLYKNLIGANCLPHHRKLKCVVPLLCFEHCCLFEVEYSMDFEKSKIVFEEHTTEAEAFFKSMGFVLLKKPMQKADGF